MIFLSLGSNLSSRFGDKFDNLNLAMSYLDNYKILIDKKSSFYQTPSYPNKKEPSFINVTISVKTHLPPVDLFTVLIFIEEKLERKRNIKNDPRTCDIDIIDYNGEILDLKYKNFDLLIPHKNLRLRNFVLYPLQEIAPNWKHPKTNESIDTLINNLSTEDRKSIFKIKKD